MYSLYTSLTCFRYFLVWLEAFNTFLNLVLSRNQFSILSIVVSYSNSYWRKKNMFLFCELKKMYRGQGVVTFVVCCVFWHLITILQKLVLTEESCLLFCFVLNVSNAVVSRLFSMLLEKPWRWLMQLASFSPRRRRTGLFRLRDLMSTCRRHSTVTVSPLRYSASRHTLRRTKKSSHSFQASVQQFWNVVAS